MDNKSDDRDIEILCASDSQWKCDFTEYFFLIFPPILLVIGTVGNILSICVLTRKPMRGSTSSMYLAALAVADLFVLYIALLREWIVYLTGNDYRKINDITCKIQLWFQFISFLSSVWILTALTIDRLISITKPLFAKVHCTVKISTGVIISVVAVVTLLGMQYFEMERREIYLSNTTTIYLLRCEPKPETFVFYYKYWPFILLLITSIIPFLIILISNGCIIYTVLQRRRSMRQIQPDSNINTVPVENAQSKSMTKMLVAISIFFMLASLPTCLYLVLEAYLYQRQTVEEEVNRKLFWALASFCFYCNSSCNFVVYCVSGTLFRKSLHDMLYALYKRCRRVGSRVQPEQQGVTFQAHTSTYNQNTNISCQRKTEVQGSKLMDRTSSRL